MEQTEFDLITKLFDVKAADTDKLISTAMEDIRRTIALASANTDGQIFELNKTLKEHNGRLREVECEQKKQKKVISAISWCGKHWYVPAGIIILIIFVLIPIVDILGIKGIISLIK
jgi:hypothetical protein